MCVPFRNVLSNTLELLRALQISGESLIKVETVSINDGETFWEMRH